jgi:hypothetical protein
VANQQYKIIDVDEDELNRLAGEGWRFAAVIALGMTPNSRFLLEREVTVDREPWVMHG